MGRTFRVLHLCSARDGLFAHFRIKGANFLGFESAACNRGGSWSKTPLTDVFKLLKYNGFNALRVPLSWEGCPESTDEELKTFVTEAGNHGLLVALTMNTLRPGLKNDNGYVGGDDGYKRLHLAWQRQVDLFCDPEKYWNVFAADLLDSPHGMYWGPPPEKTDNMKHVDDAHYWPQVCA